MDIFRIFCLRQQLFAKKDCEVNMEARLYNSFKATNAMTLTKKVL